MIEHGHDAMPKGRPASVLVVDDEAVVTQSLRAFLQLETDYEVLVAQSPLEALDLLRDRPVDVVISDFLMPQMNGLQFLSEVKKLYPDTPRLMLTGYADKENTIRAINEVGLFQYLEKPWDNDELKLVIRNALANKSLGESLRQRIRELDALLMERDKLLQRDEHLRRELELARRLQTSLLPETLPNRNGISLAAHYRPALEIGGDFYDVIPLSGDRLAVLVADATGHGIQAALSTAILKFSFNRFANSDATPTAIIKGMNEDLLRGLPAETYVAAAVLSIDPGTAECRLVNAGLPHPFHLKRRLRDARRVIANGFMLGAVEDHLFDVDSEYTLRLEQGDLLLVYTDGVSEVESESGEPFDRAMFKTHLLTHAEKSAAELSGALLEASRRFSGPHHEWDDVTIVGIDRT